MHGHRKLKHKICVVILCATVLILRRIERDINKMCVGLREKYPLFLSNYNCIFSTNYQKYSHVEFNEIRPLAAEVFHC